MQHLHKTESLHIQLPQRPTFRPICKYSLIENRITATQDDILNIRELSRHDDRNLNVDKTTWINNLHQYIYKESQPSSTHNTTKSRSFKEFLSDTHDASIKKSLETIIDQYGDAIDDYQWYFLQGSLLQWRLSNTQLNQRDRHVCKVMDVGVIPYSNQQGQVEFNTYICMESYQCDVFQFLTDHPRCSCATKIEICRQMIASVEYALLCNVLHMDVKLENFVISWSPDGVDGVDGVDVALIDFECAKIVPRHQHPRMKPCKPHKKARLTRSPIVKTSKSIQQSQLSHSPIVIQGTFKKPFIRPPECKNVIANFSEQSLSWMVEHTLRNLFGTGFGAHVTNDSIEHFLAKIKPCGTNLVYARPSIAYISQCCSECFHDYKPLI